MAILELVRWGHARDTGGRRTSDEVPDSVVEILWSVAEWWSWYDYPATADQWLRGMQQLPSIDPAGTTLVQKFRYEWTENLPGLEGHLQSSGNSEIAVRDHAAICTVHARGIVMGLLDLPEMWHHLFAGLQLFAG